MRYLFLFFFMLTLSQLTYAEPRRIKCDANNNKGTLTFERHRGEEIKLAVGGDRATFDLAELKLNAGIYRATFQSENANKKILTKIKPVTSRIFLIVLQQLPAGFILIRDGGPGIVIVDFQQPDEHLSFGYTNFDNDDDETPPDNHLGQEYAFTSSHFVLEMQKLIAGKKHCLARLMILRKDKKLEVSSAGLMHEFNVTPPLDKTLVRPPSVAPVPLNVVHDDDDNDRDSIGSVSEIPPQLSMNKEDVPTTAAAPSSVSHSSSASTSLFDAMWQDMANIAQGFTEMLDLTVKAFSQMGISQDQETPLVLENPAGFLSVSPLFHRAGWGTGAACPKEVRLSSQALYITFGAIKPQEQAVTCTLDRGVSHVLFNAKLMGNDLGSQADFYVWDVTAQEKIEVITNGPTSITETNDAQYDVWFTPQDDHEYKIYFASHSNTNEEVTLRLSEFGTD